MIVAERYAKALMELAAEQNHVDAVREDMKLVRKVIGENRDLALMLESPVINKAKKIVVLEQVFGKKINKLTLSFIKLITSKNREAYLSNIAEAFDEQYKHNKHIYTAVVTSAMGLDKKTREKVLELIKSQTKGEVELIEKVDPETIGGFVLKIGDRQIDRTVARQLSNLKKQFTSKGLN
jgi:F-type H+-transporting ATPase subunit delta